MSSPELEESLMVTGQVVTRVRQGSMEYNRRVSWITCRHEGEEKEGRLT
jgi:hypothetical protein